VTLVLQIAAGIILPVVVLNLWARCQSRRFERTQQPKSRLTILREFRDLIIGLAVVVALAAVVMLIVR
jgi:hypothetical protein